MLVNELFNFFIKINEPIFILKEDKIEFINESGIKFLRLENKTFIGENFLSILIPHFDAQIKYLNIFTEKLNSPRQSESFEVSDFSFIGKNDKLSVEITKLSNNYSIIYLKTNELKLRSLIKNYEREKLILNEKIRKTKNLANEMKSVFLNQVNHEIRTPLNAILSFAALIKEELKDHIPPDMQTGFEVIKRGGDRVIRTADLMLNMSEVLTNAFRFNPQKLNLFEDVFYNIFEKYKSLAKEKNLNFTYEVHCNNTEVLADEFMLVQIIDNLINNALKFTIQGEVKILFFSRTKNNLVFAVRDTGIGISEEYIKKLYQPFSQEDEGTIRSFEGNGLGLSLTKKYCEINKIDLHVESLKNNGSTFYLEFNQNEYTSEIHDIKTIAK